MPGDLVRSKGFGGRKRIVHSMAGEHEIYGQMIYITPWEKQPYQDRKTTKPIKVRAYLYVVCVEYAALTQEQKAIHKHMLGINISLSKKPWTEENRPVYLAKMNAVAKAFAESLGLGHRFKGI